MTILETERLWLRELASSDADFVLALLNDPDWLRFVGDRKVHTLEAARRYIEDGPLAMYERVGFGLWLVERKTDRAPLGICGLVARVGLGDVEIGFAFMPAHRGQGYAREAAAACLRHGQGALGLKRIVAITSLDNDDSIRLLEQLGFRFERTLRLSDSDEDLNLFAIETPGA
jgi:[ribosomal protein S5]-alanine N-acetyltransferase